MQELRPPQLNVHGDACEVIDEHGAESWYPKHQYSKLTSGRSIRLLRALNPLELGLKAYELVEHKLPETDIETLDVSSSPYVAMSYCWGTSKASAPLLITTNGQQSIIPVTLNAWEAIERTAPALTHFKKTFWIDQVCIDQEDDVERAQQVEIMGEVYRRCWHCMIWLGPAEAATKAAYDLMQQLHKAINQYESLPILEREMADLSHAQIRTRLASKTGTDQLPPSSDPGWSAIARLLERDWFKRIWTFQEAVLCHVGDASFRCGHYNIQFKTFSRASMFLGDQWTPGGIDFGDVKFSDGRAHMAAIAKFRDHVARRDPLPLIWLLQNNQLRHCRVQNDRIFAWLGMRIEDGPDFHVAVDYEKPTRDLYVDVARKIIRSRNSLRMCAESPERAGDGSVDGLPSWAPDWTRTPVATTFEKMNIGNPYFDAAKGRPQVDYEPEDPDILSTRGRIVDYVEEIIDAEVPNDVSGAARREVMIQTVIPLLVATLRSRETSQTEQQIAHILIKTITLNGYIRAMNQGQSGLLPEAWSEATSSYMVDCMLTGVTPVAAAIGGIDPESWVLAFVRQTLACVNRRFALTKSNRFGHVPMFAKPGDSIAILHGSSLPFVLRNSEGGCLKMIGTCFVDGLMYGEAVNWGTGDEFNIN